MRLFLFRKLDNAKDAARRIGLAKGGDCDLIVDVPSESPDSFAEVANRLSVASLGANCWSKGGLTVVVDLCDASALSPLVPGWEGLLGMLIVAFPEVRWRFVVIDNPSGCIGQRYHAGERRPTFDGLSDSADLREWVRQVTNSTAFGAAPDMVRIPVREPVAVALDDEPAFALMHAYTAYRFGFRAYAVSREDGAELFFAGGGSSPRVNCTFEDVYLSFPDARPHHRYADLSDSSVGSRRSRLPRLESVDYRVFVTTNHSLGCDRDIRTRNAAYIKSGACVGSGLAPDRCGRVVLKPHRGMFDLWRKAGFSVRSACDTGSMQGMTPTDWGRHSAPGRILEVATFMVNRADSLLQRERPTIADSLLAATLATDALEWLGDRTPSTSMEALRVKHVAEVAAECQFSGVQYRLEIQLRIQEIGRRARSLSRWFDPARRRMAAENAEMTTLLEMMRILRDHGQFDESALCQNRLRRLHNNLRMQDRPVRMLMLPVYRYFELVLGSLPAFGAAILAWLGLFTGIFALLGGSRQALQPAGPVGVFEQAFTSFTASNGFTSSDWWWNAVTIGAVMVGLTHIGVFVSHMYMVVARKD